MSFFSWLGIRRTTSQRGRTGNKPRPTCRLRVEQLEDRAVPASFSAATVPELIDAMNAANLTAEADTIALVAGTTFTLTDVNNHNLGATGLPTIAAGADLTILGNGGVIERSTAAGTPAFRLFDVAAGAALKLQNMTVQGGLAYGQGASAWGGAICCQGDLALTQVIVQNNQALGSDGMNASVSYGRSGEIYTYPTHGVSALGGGVFVVVGTAMLTDVTLSSNSAQGGKGGDGMSVAGSGGSREKYHAFKIPAANGGWGLGGGLYVGGGTITLRNTFTTANTALGGAAGRGVGGSAGQGVGGGFYIEADVSAVFDAFTVDHFKRNRASSGDPNVFGPYTVAS